MFTGLVSSIGEVTGVADRAGGRTLTIATPWGGVRVGESIAVDGVCLTVTSVTGGTFTTDAMGPTCMRTTIGEWTVGRRVNLERALRASDRLGGHLVQGHVDGVGDVVLVSPEADALRIDVVLWDGTESLVVPQGSITIDGVSLTVTAVRPPHTVSVALIEQTRRATTLGGRRRGDRVNVELDIVGKYVRQLLAPWSAVVGVIR